MKYLNEVLDRIVEVNIRPEVNVDEEEVRRGDGANADVAHLVYWIPLFSLYSSMGQMPRQVGLHTKSQSSITIKKNQCHLSGRPE